MEILIRGDKIKVTEAIEGYIKEKLQKIDKYIETPDNIKANVVINVKGRQQKVEITIPLKKFILRAEETQEDLYTAIDVIIDKIERQIRKNKTKIQSKKIREYKDIIYNEIEEEIETETEKKIVKRKKVESKPMSEEEAILQMELLGHQFYLYNDSISLKTTVIYKRKDGDYGIIESQ